MAAPIPTALRSWTGRRRQGPSTTASSSTPEWGCMGATRPTSIEWRTANRLWRPCFGQAATLSSPSCNGRGIRHMRLAAAAACAVPVIAAIVSGAEAQAQEGGFGHPSCIASTLPAARAQARLIPADLAGPALGQVRGVVVRSLTWRHGQTIKVCFHSGSRKAQERVIRIAREWMQYANVTFDFEEGGAPRACKGDNSEDIKVTFE